MQHVALENRQLRARAVLTDRFEAITLIILIGTASFQRRKCYYLFKTPGPFFSSAALISVLAGKSILSATAGPKLCRLCPRSLAILICVAR